MGVAPVAGAASVSIPLRMRKGSCCTTFSQLPRMRRWQASRCYITSSQLYLCDRNHNSPYQFFFSSFFTNMPLRRYSRRDLVGRLSSLPNGAKRGLDGVTCPELRLRGGAHGRTALSYLPFSLPMVCMWWLVWQPLGLNYYNQSN